MTPMNGPGFLILIFIFLFWARIDCGEQAGGHGLAKHSSIHVIAPALLSSAGGLGKIIGVLGQGQGALGALLSEEGEKKKSL